MTAREVDDVCGVLLKHADNLRAKGVRELTVGDVKATFAPPEVTEPPASNEPTATNDLDDPSTYGLPADAPTPGFKRPKKQGT